VNCIECGGSLKKKSKRVRTKGCTPFLFELIGVIGIIYSFLISEGFNIIIFGIGFIFLLLGHSAAYTKQVTFICKSCKTEYLQ